MNNHTLKGTVTVLGVRVAVEYNPETDAMSAVVAGVDVSAWFAPDNALRDEALNALDVDAYLDRVHGTQEPLFKGVAA